MAQGLEMWLSQWKRKLRALNLASIGCEKKKGKEERRDMGKHPSLDGRTYGKIVRQNADGRKQKIVQRKQQA